MKNDVKIIPVKVFENSSVAVVYSLRRVLVRHFDIDGNRNQTYQRLRILQQT